MHWSKIIWNTIIWVRTQQGCTIIPRYKRFSCFFFVFFSPCGTYRCSINIPGKGAGTDAVGTVVIIRFWWHTRSIILIIPTYELILQLVFASVSIMILRIITYVLLTKIQQNFPYVMWFLSIRAEKFRIQDS